MSDTPKILNPLTGPAVCACFGDPTKLEAKNLCHLRGCPRFWLDMQCAQCTTLLLRGENDPPCVIENDTAHIWCTSECADAWMNDPQFPERKVGWVSTSDLTPEQLNAALNDIGLALEGVGERKPS